MLHQQRWASIQFVGRNSVHLFLTLVLALSFAQSLWAQAGGTGALAVTVLDTSGAVVPSATVDVTNDAGVSRTQATGADGSVVFAQLPPGSYTVTISANGFQKSVVNAVPVVTTETHALNQVLQVGTQTQAVVVTATEQAVQTQSSTLGAVVDQTSIESLPLDTRNYTQILSLSPGVVGNVSDATALGRGSPLLSANGLDTRGNDYKIDGISTIAANSDADGTVSFWGSIPLPNPDAVQEFKVQTSNYDASYGRGGGANVNVVTKSGTNVIHGTLFEFLRNDIFNANLFFLNSIGSPRAEMKQNQYGGAIGGPLKKNKLFGFLSYQGTRQINGDSRFSATSVIDPVGLYGVGTNRTAAALGAAFCPSNTSTGIATFPAVTGVANPASDQVACSGSNINPIALALLNAKLPGGYYVIPVPQTIRGGNAFSAYSVPSTFAEDQIVSSLDYVISPKNTLSLTYMYVLSPLNYSVTTAGEGPGMGNHVNGQSQTTIAKLTTVFSDRLVNQAYFSSAYSGSFSTSKYPLTSASLGITPANPAVPRAPVMAITGFSSFGGFVSDDSFTPITTYTWGDAISLIHGRHSLRFGYEEQYQNARIWAGGSSRGTLTFQTFSDFLLGMSAAQNGTSLGNIFSVAGRDNPSTYPNLYRQNFVNGFVQDDFRVNSRLTLNLGLRWEYDGLPYDDVTVNGQKIGGTEALWPLLESIPIPPASGTLVGLTVAKSYTGPMPVGLTQRNSNSTGNGRQPMDDFSPRVGFAWQPLSSSGRFVLRGGGGRFYDVLRTAEIVSIMGANPPLAENVSRSSTGNAAASLAVPFNPVVNLGTFTDFYRTPTSVLSFAAANPNFVTPTIFQWNMDLQYEVKPSWVVDLAYVANRAERIDVSEALNLPQLASVTNPINCGGPTGCITTNTAANAAQRVPVLGIGAGAYTMAVVNGGDSHYESVQAALHKTFSHGLTTNVSYTFGHCITDMVGTATTPTSTLGYNRGLLNPSVGEGNCDYNRPQRLIVSYTYTLPNVYDNKGFAGRALSGWALSGISTFQNGLPMTLSDTRAGTAFGSVGTAGANLCPGMTIADIRTPGSIESNLTDYLNKNAFCAPPLSGGAGSGTLYGNLSRAVVLGPGQQNWDMSIIKNTKVGGFSESANLEFRAEFFNAFNHPIFSPPASLAVNSSTFGQITTTASGPRIIQFALKYTF